MILSQPAPGAERLAGMRRRCGLSERSRAAVIFPGGGPNDGRWGTGPRTT